MGDGREGIEDDMHVWRWKIDYVVGVVNHGASDWGGVICSFYFFICSLRHWHQKQLGLSQPQVGWPGPCLLLYCI